MAIHTGHVLVYVRASDPSDALLTIGDTLSRAVRLLGHAAPGDIILSLQVAGLVEGWIELRTLEGLTKTGSSDAVEAAAVVGLRPRRSALEVYGKRPLSRFVGRVRELAELHHRFSQVEKGRGHIVGIVGEPGVGKSRLCYEVSILQRARRWLVLETSPVAYGEEIPYLPVVDLLKTCFQLGPSDTSRTIQDKVMTRLQSLDEGLRSIAPPLCALLDLPVGEAHALRGQVWEKVVRYAHRAGTRAAERSAYGPAGTFFDQALDALSHLPESHETRAQAFDLYKARQLMHAARRELEPLLAYSEKMLSLAESLGDPHRLALALTSLGNAWSQLGANVRALELTERGLALAETVGAVDLLIHLRVDMGMLCRGIGDYRRGATVLTQAAKLLRGDLARERLGRPLYPAAVVASWHLATCLSALGEFRQALRSAEEGLHIAETLQQPGNLLLAYLSYCKPLLQQGQFHDAVPRLEGAMALHTSDLGVWYPMTAGPLGFAYAMTGRLADAMPILEQAVERAQRVDRRRETQWRAYLSEAYLRAERLHDAHAMAEQLLALGRERGERSTEARGRHLLGEIAMHCDPMQAKEAEAHYRQALAVAEELGMRPLQAHCHHGLGSLYAKIGQQEQARDALSTAIGLYRAMDMIFWLPQAEATLAQIGGEKGTVGS